MALASSAAFAAGPPYDGILTIGLRPTASYILPGTGSNCLDAYRSALTGETRASVPAMRAVFPSFGVSWSGNDTLYAAYLDVAFDGTSLASYRVRISGDELDAMLGVTNSGAFNDGAPRTIDTATSRRSRDGVEFPSCSLSFGGLRVVGDQPFTVQGTATLVGTAVNATGDEREVRAQAPLTLRYVP